MIILFFMGKQNAHNAQDRPKQGGDAVDASGVGQAGADGVPVLDGQRQSFN